MSVARKLRISLLLLVLAVVAFDAWITRARSTSWDKTLRATVYPLVADGRPATREYVARLDGAAFDDIERFIAAEAQRYGIALAQPLQIRLGPLLAKHPPAPPADRNPLGTAWWSLKLRWWANRREAGQPRPHSQVRLFVLYYDPNTTPVVAHSLGIKEGLIGVVHAFASRHMTATNNVVIAHELLHTLGATDKYDPATSLPRYPQGYAEPQRAPRHPQHLAELMAGRIPLSAERAEIPASLDQARVGPLTAREIGWVQP